MATIARANRKKPNLNLTPLIDVIFLLIVFFMLTSKFSLDKVIDAGLAPVSSKSSNESTQSNTVLVLLEENGDFKLWSQDGAGENKLQPIIKLQKVIAPLLVRDKTRELVVVVHPKTTVQQAVSALGAVQQAGATKVRLAEGN